MRSFLKFSIPPWPDTSFIDRSALFQLHDNDLKHLMLQCELALSCIKNEIKRREKPGSRQPSSFLWKTIQFYHGASFTLPPPYIPEEKQRFLSLLGHERLSGLPNTTFSRLSDSEKATIVQLSLGPWSVNSVANLADAPSRSSLGQPPALQKELQPVNTSAETLSRLSPDALQVVKLFAFAGGVVPTSFIWDVYESKSWGSDGQIRLQKSTLAGVFQSSERCEQALQQLHECDAVELRDNGKKFAVKPALQSYITSKEPWANDHRILALTATIYAFPKDSYLEPIFFAFKGLSLISTLMSLLPYLWQLKQPTAEFLEVAFEAFFSASHFADIIWKRTALNVAEQIAHLLCDPIYLVRINFRKTALSRLRDHITAQPFSLSGHPGIDARTNAWLGRFRLHQAQVLIDGGASTGDILTELRLFHSLNPRYPSHQERTIQLEADFLIAKSLRFEGNFCSAISSFDRVLEEAYKYGSRMSWRVAPHYAETQAEVGCCRDAIDVLQTTIENITDYNSMHRPIGKRLLLASANCHLMRLLWSSIQEKPNDTELISQTLHQFQSLTTQFSGIIHVPGWQGGRFQ